MKYMWSIPFLSSALKKRFLPAVYHCKLQWVVHSLIMSFSIPRHVIPNKTFICQHLSRYYNYHRIYIQFCMPNIDLHDILLGFFKLSIQSSDNEDNETDFNRNPNVRKWVLFFLSSAWIWHAELSETHCQKANARLVNSLNFPRSQE